MFFIETHICVSKLGHHCSNNGLSPVWRQSIIWTNADLLSIWSTGTNFSEIEIKTQQNESEIENVVCKMAVILFWLQYVEIHLLLRFTVKRGDNWCFSRQVANYHTVIARLRYDGWLVIGAKTSNPCLRRCHVSCVDWEKPARDSCHIQISQTSSLFFFI